MPFQYPDAAKNITWLSLENQHGTLDFAEMTEDGQMFVDITYEGNVHLHRLIQCTNETGNPNIFDVTIKDKNGNLVKLWFHQYKLMQALNKSLDKVVKQQ